MMYLVDMRDASIREMPIEKAFAMAYHGFRYEHYRGVDRIWTAGYWNGKRRMTFRTNTPYEATAHEKLCGKLEQMLLDFRPTQYSPYVFFTRRSGAEHFAKGLQ